MQNQVTKKYKSENVQATNTCKIS